jgi:hypothetical protein
MLARVLLKFEANYTFGSIQVISCDNTRRAFLSCFTNSSWQVSVPSSSLFNIVTVRCGHCGNLLSVNMGASLQTLPLQDPQVSIISGTFLWLTVYSLYSFQEYIYLRKILENKG